jgi:hypothetical protein
LKGRLAIGPSGRARTFFENVEVSVFCLNKLTPSLLRRLTLFDAAMLVMEGSLGRVETTTRSQFAQQR